MQAPDALVVQDLTVERDERPILEGLSFTLPAGAALVVTGPNGTGKSTLLRAIAGLLPLRRGRIALQHGDQAASIDEHAHYLGHADGLKRALTALANLTFAAGWAGATGLAPAIALQRLGIGHVAELPVGYLSAGQRRRVALARLMVSRRPLWLIDEPTTALDAAAEATFGAAMRAHLAEGGLIVAATHAALPIPARALQLGAA